MALSLAEFLDRLTASGLGELAHSVASMQPESSHLNAHSVANKLIADGKLTSFQTARLLGDPALPLTFGPYLLIDQIGAGGMGVVYKAEHCHMNRIVAIKQMRVDSSTSPVALHRFYREVKTLAQLNHPNIVTAYDAGEAHGSPYLAMEYVQGRDLSRILKDHDSIPVAQAVDIILQAASGLAYAHQKGVVHRDIKPGNVLVAHDGTAKILDLGLACFDSRSGMSGSQSTLTEFGGTMGTPDFMAPEQAENAHSVDCRADIYSLGCTLYRCIAGVLPYVGDTKVQKLIAHAALPTPRLSEVIVDVPLELEELCFQMMAKMPAERPATMQRVVDELERLLASGRIARFDRLTTCPRDQRTEHEQSLFRIDALPNASNAFDNLPLSSGPLPACSIDPPGFSGAGPTVLTQPVMPARPASDASESAKRLLHSRAILLITACVIIVSGALVYRAAFRDDQPSLNVNSGNQFTAGTPAIESNPRGSPSNPERSNAHLPEKDTPILSITPGLDVPIYSSAFETDALKWRAEKGRFAIHEGRLTPFDAGAREAQRWVLDFDRPVDLKDGELTIRFNYSRIGQSSPIITSWPKVSWGLGAKDGRVLRVDGTTLQVTADLQNAGQVLASAKGKGLPPHILGTGMVALSATWTPLDSGSVRARLEYSDVVAIARTGSPWVRLVLADAGDFDGQSVPFTHGDGMYHHFFVEIKGGGVSASISNVSISQRIANDTAATSLTPVLAPKPNTPVSP